MGRCTITAETCPPPFIPAPSAPPGTERTLLPPFHLGLVGLHGSPRIVPRCVRLKTRLGAAFLVFPINRAVCRKNSFPSLKSDTAGSAYPKRKPPTPCIHRTGGIFLRV